jgi:hypothetical protein
MRLKIYTSFYLELNIFNLMWHFFIDLYVLQFNLRKKTPWTAEVLLLTLWDTLT